MKRFNLIKPLVLGFFVAALLFVDAHAFGLLEKIGNGRQPAKSSALSTFIRGRYGRTVMSDTFAGFVWQRCLYGVCVPKHSAVTRVRVEINSIWKEMHVGESTTLWSPGRVGTEDYQHSLFSWMKENRRDYFIFEFSAQELGGKVVVETTYEEVIPMYGNKWTYQVPFPWLVGSDDCAVRTWTVDVETDSNFSQPQFTPVMPGIQIEGRKLRGTVANAVSANSNPVLECLEHPEHRNTVIRDAVGTQKHMGVFVTPVAAEPGKRRTVSIVVQPDIANARTGPVESRLLIDALLSRIRPQDLLNVWANTTSPQRVWKKPQRAHDDNVYAVLTLLDNQLGGASAGSFSNILDSVVTYDHSDTTDHVIVLVTSGASISVADLAKLPPSVQTSIVGLSNALASGTLQSVCWSRGGTYKHVASWYGWRETIPPIADSCLGMSVNTVGGTASNALSPEPPTNTELMHGSRRVVYSYDDGRPASAMDPDFAGLIARTWANERISRLTRSILAGVSAPVQQEMANEIRRIGTTYQIWSPYNPFIEAP